MPQKVLFCASSLSHITNFHLPYLKLFRDWGFDVHVAADSNGTVPHASRVAPIPFCKSLKSPKNLLAILQVRKLLREEQYEIVVTNTSLAGAVVRAAILFLDKQKGPKVIHICHGYLFNMADGFKKWFYLLPEKICAGVTDVLVTMNREDEAIAKRYRLYKDELRYTHGMGIDIGRFQSLPETERRYGRAALGFHGGDFLFLYAAEFSKRKNQKELITAFAEAFIKMSNTYLILPGDGKLFEECKELARKLGIAEKVRFPGYVKEMQRLYPICDAVVSSSRIEGLPFNIMEAMCCGLPVLASDIKGHRELLEGEAGGTLYRTPEELTEGLMSFAAETPKPSWEDKLSAYKIETVFLEMEKIYRLSRPG